MSYWIEVGCVAKNSDKDSDSNPVECRHGKKKERRYHGSV